MFRSIASRHLLTATTRNWNLSPISRIAGWIALAVLALATRFIVIQLTEHGRTRPSKGQAILEVENPTELFGHIDHEGKIVTYVVLKNNAGKPIEVAELSTKCSCSVVKPTFLLVQAHARAKAQVVIDQTLLDISGQNSEVDRNTFSLSITAKLKGAAVGARTWNVRGTVQRSFSIARSPLICRSSLIKGETPVVETTEIVTKTPCSHLTPYYDANLITAKIAPISQRNNAFLLSVAPTPKLILGRHEIPIFLKADRKDGVRLTDVVIYSVDIISDVSPVPAAIYDIARPLGEEFSVEIFLDTLSGKPFTVSGVQTNSSNVHVQFIRKTPAGGSVYRVRIVNQITGPKTCRLIFHVQVDPSRGGPPEAIEVPIHIHGLAKLHRGSIIKSAMKRD